MSIIYEDFSAVLVGIPSNEKPLHGLAGWFDWKFSGLIHGFIRDQKITGEFGEFGLIPSPDPRNAGSWFQLFFWGLGPVSFPGDRPKIAEENLLLLKNRVQKSGLSRVLFPISDFGFSPSQLNRVEKILEGSPLTCIS